MKYKKKPIIVEAVQYTSMNVGIEDGFDKLIVGTISDASVLAAVHSFYGQPPVYATALLPYINTIEGKTYISKNDYIITGVSGESFLCKPDIFKKTYELVEGEN